LGLALDEPSEQDEVFKEAGFNLIMDKELIKRFGGVKIDFQSSRWFGSRFFITPKNEADSACC
jgi:Fe-S cluster assembly iron-binding protein IscA